MTPIPAWRRQLEPLGDAFFKVAMRLLKAVRYAERHTCPRRAADCGPWKWETWQDTWERGRWGRLYKMRDAFDRWTGRLAGGGTYWPEAWGRPPRTCSFCFGVHPDDAVQLVLAGWELEGTSKTYKRYLQPPGYHRRTRDLASRMMQEVLEEAPPAVVATVRALAPRSPVPPVKLYSQHFDQDQAARINAALRRARVVAWDRTASQPPVPGARPSHAGGRRSGAGAEAGGAA